MKKCSVCEIGKLIEVNYVVSEIEGHFFVEKEKDVKNVGKNF